MSYFEIVALIGVVAVAIIATGIIALVSVLEKWTKHLANIADRLVEIDETLTSRR